MRPHAYGDDPVASGCHLQRWYQRRVIGCGSSHSRLGRADSTALHKRKTAGIAGTLRSDGVGVRSDRVRQAHRIASVRSGSQEPATRRAVPNLRSCSVLRPRLIHPLGRKRVETLDATLRSKSQPSVGAKHRDEQ
jgi:hypothetical protein